MKRIWYQSFSSFALALLLCFGFLFCAQAETASPSIADATPALIEPASTSEAAASASPEATQGITPAGGTYYDKGQVEAFDGTPDSTGNSAGEIVFMLAIFLFCLFFVVEAVVQWIRKKE